MRVLVEEGLARLVPRAEALVRETAVSGDPEVEADARGRLARLESKRRGLEPDDPSAN
jgi:hypothetical protein